MKLQDACKSKEITVVGNGPLSPDDRQMIEQSACIFRFNDRKNMLAGDRTDVHVVRDNTIHAINRAQQDDVCILPIAARWSTLDKLNDLRNQDYKLLEPLLIYESYHKKDKVIDDSAVIFPSCKAKSFHAEQVHGPTSGAAVIDWLEQDPSVETIHVFGMNWNKRDPHVDFVKKKLVETCCTKCEFHKTESPSYFPA